MNLLHTTGDGLVRLWERARTEPGLARNLLAIVALVALGSAVGGYFLANQRFTPPWEDKYTVYATFQEAPAISPGNGQEVRIAGVPVGDIRAADLSKRGQAVLTLRINDDQPVYRNAIAVLRAKSPLNEMYIELDPGTPLAGRLEPGQRLSVTHTRRPVQVDEVLAHLDGDTRAALASLLVESDSALARAPRDLPAGLRGTRSVLAHLRPVFAQLAERRQNLARLVTALSQVSTAAAADDRRLSLLASSLQVTLGTLSQGRTGLNATLAQLPELSASLRRASAGVTRLAGQLNPTLESVRTSSAVLPGALQRLHTSVGRLDHTLDAARPVLRKATPVVRDLRPAVADLNPALTDSKQVTAQLDPVTAGALPYLNDLQAFVYNTNSVFSLTDGNRGILRGQVNVTPQSAGDPAGGTRTGER